MDCDRLVYNSPSGNVDGGIVIRQKGGTTVSTGEQALRLSIGFGDMATGRTFPAGIPWVNEDHGNSCQFRLVTNKRIQLKESPISKTLSVSLAKPCPGSDALQLLKSDAPARAFGYRDNFFGNAMVGMPLKPTLSLSYFLQVPLFGLRTSLLKYLPDLGCALPDSINPRTGECIAVARRGDIDNTFIHTKKAFGVNRHIVRNLYYDVQKELAALVEKISLSFLFLSFERAIVPENNRDFIPAIYGVDAGRGKIREGQKTRIVHDRRILFERALHLLVQLVRFFDLLERANHELRTKRRESGPDFPIQRVMHLEGAEALLPKGVLRDMVTRCIKRLESFAQGFNLLSIWKELHLYRKFHWSRIAYILSIIKHFLKGGRRFSPLQAAGYPRPHAK